MEYVNTVITGVWVAQKRTDLIKSVNIDEETHIIMPLIQAFTQLEVTDLIKSAKGF